MAANLSFQGYQISRLLSIQLFHPLDLMLYEELLTAFASSSTYSILDSIETHPLFILPGASNYLIKP